MSFMDRGKVSGGKQGIKDFVSACYEGSAFDKKEKTSAVQLQSLGGEENVQDTDVNLSFSISDLKPWGV